MTASGSAPVLKRILRRWRAQTTRSCASERAILERIEQRALAATLDAHAYVDHRIAASQAAPDTVGRRIEERALLATQEAKAYADEAIGSLGNSLRSISHAVLRLTSRVNELEAALSATSAISERLDRIEFEVSRMAEGAADKAAREDVRRLDHEVRTTASHLVQIEVALREIQANSVTRPAESEGSSQLQDSPRLTAAANSHSE